MKRLAMIKKIKDLESKITGLNLVITNLNNKIVDITKERDILKKIIEKILKIIQL